MIGDYGKKPVQECFWVMMMIHHENNDGDVGDVGDIGDVGDDDNN